MSYGTSGTFPNYGTAGGYSSSPSTMTGIAFHNQLCDSISSNIFAINNNATVIDRALKQLGTVNDTSLLRDKIQQTIHNTSATLVQTNKSIKDLNSLVQQGGEKQQRLQLERLSNEFRDTLQRYSSLQKQIATKMKYTMPAKPPQKSAAASAWGEDDDGEDEKQSLIEEDKRMQKQQHLESELEMEQAMLLEREERIAKIESDMVDVNQIMIDLSSLVHQQAESIYTIEANVERAAGNVDDGRQELFKASNYQKKYRKKMCLLVVILLFVAAALGLIIYFSVK